jgi:hypothetical protein
MSDQRDEPPGPQRGTLRIGWRLVPHLSSATAAAAATAGADTGTGEEPGTA